MMAIGETEIIVMIAIIKEITMTMKVVAVESMATAIGTIE